MRNAPNNQTLTQVKLPGYLTIDQAAARMRTTRDYLHRLRQLGALRPVGRVDRVLIYRERDVVDYVLAHPGLGKLRATCELHPREPRGAHVPIVSAMQHTYRLPASLAALAYIDRDWVRCRQCSQAFWGVANATAVIRAKVERHARKAHGAQAGARPQRRNAAAALPVPDESLDAPAGEHMPLLRAMHDAIAAGQAQVAPGEREDLLRALEDAIAAGGQLRKVAGTGTAGKQATAVALTPLATVKPAASYGH